MSEKEIGEIPELKGAKGLPVTFQLLSKKAVSDEQEKNLFFFVGAYQGLALAEAYHKPYSKIINWNLLNG